MSYQIKDPQSNLAVQLQNGRQVTIGKGNGTNGIYIKPLSIREYGAEIYNEHLIPYISHQHAIIQVSGDGKHVFLTDLSKNGIYIAGERLQKGKLYELLDGNEFAITPATTFPDNQKRAYILRLEKLAEESTQDREIVFNANE